jgi:hypothetical protein
MLSSGPSYDFKTPITILNSHYDPSKQLIHVMVMSLKDFQVENQKVPISHALLHWLQISLSIQDDVECAVRELKTFKGKTIPKDCWFGEDFKQLFIAAESKFELVNVVSYGIL